MLRKLRFLFERYLDQHFRIESAARPLIGRNDEEIGYLDRVTHSRHTTTIEGWVVGAQVYVQSSEIRQTVPLTILRGDVSRTLGLPSSQPVGFCITVPSSTDGLELIADVRRQK